MQWLNKVDDALDWVLGPQPTPQEPNIDDPLEADIAQLYKEDKGKYEATAAEWT